MQEAWCRSWRQCVQTLPLHTRPSPHQVVPLEHFCVGRNSCWTVALTHPKSLNDPRPRSYGAAVHSHYSAWEWLHALRARMWFRRAKTTADTWLGGSPDSLSPEKCSYCWCVHLFVSFSGSFSSNLPFIYLAKRRLTNWNWGKVPLLLISKRTLLESFPLSVFHQKRCDEKRLRLPPFPLATDFLFTDGLWWIPLTLSSCLALWRRPWV